MSVDVSSRSVANIVTIAGIFIIGGYFHAVGCGLVSLGSGNAGDAIFSFVKDICGEVSEEDKPPKHAHAFGNVGRLHKQIHEERVAALKEFHDEVVAENFPYAETNISMHADEKDKFLEALDKWTPTHQ